MVFQLPFGAPPVAADFDVPALGRLTIPVEQVDPALAATTMSMTVTSTNGVPVVVERSMWWPARRLEGHATLATNTTGTAWAVADGETGVADNAPHLPAGRERPEPDRRLAAGDAGPRRRAADRARSTPTR